MSARGGAAGIPPRVLVVAGHDPSYRGPRGGAGVDADRETLERHGARAACVVTAWTEQDGTRVSSVRERAAGEWLAEARAELARPTHALKSGLLPSAAAVRALATLCDELRERAPAAPLVVDPVLAASGGEPFLDPAGVDALLAELATRDVVLTPNLPESARLAALDPAALTTRAARLAAAERLLARGARAVVQKGGHAEGELAEDLVLERGAPPVWLARPRVAGARLHGSGCRFASALAARLALGDPLPRAAARAGEWLSELLRATLR